MKLAVVSDIHGNLPALQAVVKDFRGQVDAVISLGDVVNYGPWSDECIELLNSISHVQPISGNHEEIFLGYRPIQKESDIVKKFFHVLISRFRQKDVIARWPKKVQLEGWNFIHTINNLKIYKDTTVFLESDTCIGHTHYSFHVQQGSFQLVNPGSVGQNRANLAIACYAILDVPDRKVFLKSIPYSVEPLLAEMEKLNYPAECIAYYQSKIFK